MNASQVTVIGGGISGLAAAWWLHKRGVTVTVVEQEPEVGGTMKTLRKNGWLIETGPNSALETTPLFKTLFTDLGIDNDVEYADPAGKNRYILRAGRLHPLPTSPGLFLRSRLWSWKGKLRLLKEPFVGRSSREESIAEFVERRLGKEFLDYAVNPFVAGIFAGAPESLSVQAAFPKLYALEKKYGGLIRGTIAGARERKKRGEIAKDRAQMFSFRHGMQTFPEALKKKLGKNILTSCTVETIEREEKSGEYTVRYSSGGTTVRHRSHCVIVAVPAFVTAELIRPFDRTVAAHIERIIYPPVTEVFLGYRTDQIPAPMDGFGFLIPEKERRQILGAIWSSSLFGGRAPEGCSAMTVFVGGSRQPENALRNNEEILHIVKQELRSVMGISGDPIVATITRWKKAIPQYQRGHLHLIEEIERFEQRFPGMLLSGNYRNGISVGDCIIQSDVIAQRAAEFLDTRQTHKGVKSETNIDD